MPDAVHADTAALAQLADGLDPAPAEAARAAADAVRASAPTCGDPMPGCQRFSTAVTATAERIGAFCAELQQGIDAYAAVARDSAAGYTAADATGSAGFGRAVTGF